MKEWGAMHPALRAALVGAVVWAVILGAGVASGSPLDDALANAVFYALLAGGGLFFAAKQVRATAGTLDRDGQALVYLRYPNSLPGSLSGIWEMGVATPGPCRIDFQPAVYDELIPSGRSKVLAALRVLSPPRKATHKDSKQGLPFDFQIITLESDRGVIEIAASIDILQRIQEAIGSRYP